MRDRPFKGGSREHWREGEAIPELNDASSRAFPAHCGGYLNSESSPGWQAA